MRIWQCKLLMRIFCIKNLYISTLKPYLESYVPFMYREGILNAFEDIDLSDLFLQLFVSLVSSIFLFFFHMAIKVL